MSLPHAHPSDDWIAQQSLFMGSHTPLYRQHVSMSPQDPDNLFFPFDAFID
jgi:hypothetical protein